MMSHCEMADPRSVLRAQAIPAVVPDVERFLSKTRFSPSTGCLLWTAGRSGAGYGQVRHRGRLRGAHIVSHELFCGTVQPGQVVRHSCDTPLCVHPGHLSVGTAAQNAQEAWERGRWPIRGVPLTEDERKAVRGLYALRDTHPWLTQIFLAEAMGVSAPTIRRALKDI